LPLNNKEWLSIQLGRVRALSDEQDRVSALRALAHRNDPGKGGIYENFGVFGRQGQAVNLPGWHKDPGNLMTPFINFNVGLLHGDRHQILEKGVVPLEWISNINALYDTPLVLVYETLDAEARYDLKITYSSNCLGRTAIVLMANESHVVHDSLRLQERCETHTFRLPQHVTGGGRLELKWTTPAGAQGANVAELWLMVAE